MKLDQQIEALWSKIDNTRLYFDLVKWQRVNPNTNGTSPRTIFVLSLRHTPIEDDWTEARAQIPIHRIDATTGCLLKGSLSFQFN